jgi:hypothetical protein
LNKNSIIEEFFHHNTIATFEMSERLIKTDSLPETEGEGAISLVSEQTTSDNISLCRINHSSHHLRSRNDGLMVDAMGLVQYGVRINAMDNRDSDSDTESESSDMPPELIQIQSVRPSTHINIQEVERSFAPPFASPEASRIKKKSVLSIFIRLCNSGVRFS